MLLEYVIECRLHIRKAHVMIGRIQFKHVKNCLMFMQISV